MVQNLCFQYLRSLGTVLLVKKRHPIYRGNETGNSALWVHNSHALLSSSYLITTKSITYVAPRCTNMSNITHLLLLCSFISSLLYF
ncbi:hypothetical protein PFUGPA_05938 [Plasmodium falciparum Palo Alto/Uganda]|uniref:Uncharacterized protein n=1 Tax=Plasmodium falciparum (isolate Palo Alto / Uganda) TaxID=57270 RepID=W4IRI7_PLAFP|nr:hypothetical protein PFUGPA_05938 [Plasmodium falciparum Palo Alto/Uganda]